MIPFQMNYSISETLIHDAEYFVLFVLLLVVAKMLIQYLLLQSFSIVLNLKKIMNLLILMAYQFIIDLFIGVQLLLALASVKLGKKNMNDQTSKKRFFCEGYWELLFNQK